MTERATLQLVAPLDGWCLPLAEVPDEVFAAGMLGDGLAIDPTDGLVRAPCDGEITLIAVGAHAVSLRFDERFDVLVHVGIDTVKLAGRGFEPLVRVGERVRAGDALLRFDLDIAARAAKSLVTPIVITSGLDGARIVQRHPPGTIRAGDLLLELQYANGAPASTGGGVASATVTRSLKIGLRHGLHARPAALIVKRAGSQPVQVMLSVHGRSADARSVTAIMSLGAAHGDELVIASAGNGAASAIDAIVAAIDEATRKEVSESVPAATPEPAAASAIPTGRADRLSGVVAVAGFATGRIARLASLVLQVSEEGKGIAHERAALEHAQAAVRTRLAAIGEAHGATHRDLAEAHLAILDDPAVNEAARRRIEAGASAGHAWRTSIEAAIQMLRALPDARLRERADDLRDIENQVLLALRGEAQPARRELAADSVVVADELLPSELLSLDRAHLRAICLAGGGATSHVAILAAAMGVPMLVGIGGALRDVARGQDVIVDAERGELQLAPRADELDAAKRKVSSRQAQRLADREAARQECRTRDGTRIEVLANLGSAAEVQPALDAGAEGCGLLRTEFLFIDRATAPTEDEQLGIYQQIAAGLGGRPFVLRLMDVGGDKPLPYLTLPREDNPALGLRGVRTGLRRVDLLRTQLRAALRIAPAGAVSLLVPMVTDVAEIRAVRALVDALRKELGRSEPVLLGAMIETPAAALIASHIAAEVDFFSIGSNDLTQYTLAMDRGHAELARRVDALHPAVLRAIALAAGAATHAGKVSAVCGGMAADPAAVPLLIGFGVRELSVVPAAIPALKRQVRECTLDECVALAARCLDLESAADVRALVARSVGSGESSC